MAGTGLDNSVKALLDLLPPKGESIEFNAFRDKVVAADPKSGLDAFRFALTNNQMLQTLTTVAPKQHQVMLARKS